MLLVIFGSKCLLLKAAAILDALFLSDTVHVYSSKNLRRVLQQLDQAKEAPSSPASSSHRSPQKEDLNVLATSLHVILSN